MAIKFLKKGIRYDGKYVPVFYSKGSYTEQSGIPEGSITIYARSYVGLPKELFPINETDYMTDYFDQDRAVIKPNSRYYNAVLKAMNS